MSRQMPAMPAAEVESAKLMLQHAATQQAERLRKNETFCREAYPKPGPMREASLILADAYAQSAQIWERLAKEHKPSL